MRHRLVALLSIALAAALQAHAITPGEVTQLRVDDFDRSTGTLTLSYATACGSSDYNIEFGDLADVAVYGYSGQDCGIGDSGTYAGFAPGPGSFFFIVVGNDGVAIEGSYGTALLDHGSVERPDNLSDPVCAFVQDLGERCDVPALDIVAYRPQAEAYGAPLARQRVQDELEYDPGVGIRINGDDDDAGGTPDSGDDSVAGENDLIEVELHAAPATAPDGFEYVLRRSNADIRVWNQPTKGSEVLPASDTAVISVARGRRTVWVENPAGGSTQLEFLVRRQLQAATLASDEIHLYPFTSIVIALGGEGQVPADPPLDQGNHGMFEVAIDLYRRGYDVHMYDEDVVSASGAGGAFDEVARAVLTRGVGSVAIFGYSHGAGSTNDLARRLDDNRESIGAFTIDFTGYVDGIDNDSDFDVRTETALPPASGYHANYYENPGCGFFQLCGGPIAGADFDLNVNTTPWGAGLGHFNIDDAPEVKQGLRDQVLERVLP